MLFTGVGGQRGVDSEQKRKITLGVGSVFLCWHVLVLVFATVPENSYIRDKLEPLFAPYMSLFQLYNNWHFYAPDPRATGQVLRYTVESRSGKQTVFSLSESHQRLDPAFFRYTVFASGLVQRGQYPHFYSVAQFLCHKHADLGPARILFTANFQLPYKREDYYAGLHPLDERFLRKVDTMYIPCEVGQ